MNEISDLIKISIVTIAKNDKERLERTVRSVISQSYKNIEYIIVDGNSEDGTKELLKTYENNINLLISEPDTCPYDAMNKGIKAATGDVIGLLHSGDIFNDEHVIATIAHAFENSIIQATYGDLVYYKKNTPEKIVRTWISEDFSRNNIEKGWMPPHPTVYLRKEIYLKNLPYNLTYSIAADYDFMLRLFYIQRVEPFYIKKTLVKMEIGGRSNRNILNIIISNWQAWKSWKKNGLRIPITSILLKPLRKIFQRIFI